MPEIISTEAFLDAVLPKGNHYIGFTDGTLNKAGRPIIKCSPFQSGLHGVNVATRKGDTDIYFALASFKEERIYDAKNGYMKSFRHQDNVDKLKSLWLDVDVKSYESRVACVKDVESFLSDFPDPTFIVDSGGGFHLYWCFEKELTPTQWQPLAQGLAAIAKTRGLRADYGVTIDSARVLRLPGTRNQKYSHKPLCEVKYMKAYASLDRMDELLRPHAAGMKRAGLEVDDNVVALFDPSTANDLSQGFVDGKTSKFENIVAECAVVRDSMERGGAGDEYALWKDLLHLAAFTEDGQRYAHEISNKDERYDPDNVDEFYGQSVAIRASKARGPTTCQRFSMHSQKCSICPHAGKIKTPWVLGVPIEEKFDRVPSFVRNGKTYITKMVEDEEGNMVLEEVVLADAELDNWRLMATLQEDADYELWFDVKTGKSQRTVKVTARDMADPKALRSLITNAGMGVASRQGIKLGDVAMAWVTHLHNIKEQRSFKATGWSSDFKSFVLGSQVITAEGDNFIVNPSQENEQTIGAKGSPEHWLEMAQRLLDDDEPAFTYILCAGLSGPLMSIGHFPNSMALSVYSADSGAGKTTVLNAVRAAFGDPKRSSSLSDTTNSVIIKMGNERGVPAVYDELRGHDAGKKIVEIIFQISQGKTKSRATPNAALRAQHTLHTMLICGSNIPISDYVGHETKGSDAGYARFMEIELQPKGKPDPRLDTLNGALESNYGHFGPEYIRFIIQKMDKIKALEMQIIQALDNSRQWTPVERYWRYSTAKILLAGMLVNSMGKLKVDMAKLKEYALEAIQGMRTELDDRESSDQLILGKLVSAYANQMLVTDKFKVKTGRGTVQPLRIPPHQPVVIHASVEHKKLRITNDTLQDYASKNEMSFKGLRDLLERHFNARMERMSIGGGTSFSVGTMRAMELDLTMLDGEGEELISSWLPDEDTSSPSSQPATHDS